MVFWCGEGVRFLHGFVAVAAAAAGAKERVCFYFFYRFRRDVRHFCCAFWTPFRHEIRWCFAAKKPRFRKARWRQEAGRKERKCRSGPSLLGISLRRISRSSWSRRACVFLTFSGDSEGALSSFVLLFGRLFGTKLGGVFGGVRLLHGFVAVATTAAEAEERWFFQLFLAIQQGR